MDNLKTRSALREAVSAFAVSRVLVLLVLVLSAQTSFQEIPAREGRNWHAYAQLQADPLTNSLEKILRSADASWYIGIAEKGYQRADGSERIDTLTQRADISKARNWTFFPLYPHLMKYLSPLLGGAFAAGLIIANISFFISLVLLFRLTLAFVNDRALAARAVWLLAFYPGSYFCSAPFTEPLFLALLLASFLFLHQKKLLFAGVCFSLAAATRPVGLLLLPAFFIYLYQARLLYCWRGIAALLIAPLGAVFFMTYLHYLTGDALAFSHNQLHWGRQPPSLGGLLNTFTMGMEYVITAWNFAWLNMALAMLALAGSVYFAVKKQFSFALILAIPVLAALSTGTLQSMERIVLVLFPLYILLGKWADTQNKERLLLAVSSMLLGLMTLMYGMHVTAGMA